MDNFLENFLERSIVFISEKLKGQLNCHTESDGVKLIQKVIFKHDVLIDFKLMLSSVCSGSEYDVKNEVVKKIILHLHNVLLLDVNEEKKKHAFQCMFESFISNCKENESVAILQFLIVLAHLMGIKLCPYNSSDNENFVNVCDKNFQNVFKVSISKSTSMSFQILNGLLATLSKQSLNINLPETQFFYKWLDTLIKTLAESRPLLNIYMKIFLNCGNINIHLLEKNLDIIFSNIFSQEHITNENSYNDFLVTGLKICSRFQRTVKFISKFLSNVKTAPHVLPQKTLISPDFYCEFSNLVALMPCQQSLLLMETLVQQTNDCLKSFIENQKGNKVLFSVSGQLLINYLKEVKIFASNIPNSTLQKFQEKLLHLGNNLQQFAKYLFANRGLLLKNHKVAKLFFSICYYFSEIQILINCYKEYFLPTDSKSVSATSSCDWNYCFTLEQWDALVDITIQYELNKFYAINFQMALLRLRALKLESNILFVEESTIKLVLSSFKSENNVFKVLQHVRPEDVVILMEVLNSHQLKSVVKKLFEEILNSEDMEWKTWLLSPILQENLNFMTQFFSKVLRQTGKYLSKSETLNKISWILEKSFNDENDLNLEKLSEKINCLLQKRNKIEKLLKNYWTDFSKIIEVFTCLPIIHMGEEMRKLGLSFAIGMAAISSDDENTIDGLLKIVLRFISVSVDATSCLDVGLCINWLCEVEFKCESVDKLRIKVLEKLVQNCANSELNLSKFGEIIEKLRRLKSKAPLKVLENQIIIYQELRKCCQKGKKRKSENDIIDGHENKVAKLVIESVNEFNKIGINLENYKVYFKIIIIELNRAIKINDDNAVAKLIREKIEPYFNHAVNNLKTGYDEASIFFLSALLTSYPKIRQFLPQNTFIDIWLVVKNYNKGNWSLFITNSTNVEFKLILSDLLELTKKTLLKSTFVSVNYFDIWSCFIEHSSNVKKTECQLKLQELFNYIQTCELTLPKLPNNKLLQMNNFFLFCTKSPKIIITSQMLDTILRVMAQPFCVSELSLEDFQNLFTTQVEVGCSFLSRESTWNKNKVHMIYDLFSHLLDALIKWFKYKPKSEDDYVIILVTCGFALEKWVSLMANKQEDFTRISAYFITTLITNMVSLTISPTIKIHLINCLNHFLSKSDVHTISYLLRILNPGQQQVFNTVYDQFKKYHKYSGKV